MATFPQVPEFYSTYEKIYGEPYATQVPTDGKSTSVSVTETSHAVSEESASTSVVIPTAVGDRTRRSRTPRATLIKSSTGMVHAIDLSMKQQTLAAAADQNAAYERYRRPTKRDVFLATMEQIVPWAELCSVIEPHYPKPGNGRPPVGLERMLRMYFVQHWFNLADAACEDAR